MAKMSILSEQDSFLESLKKNPRDNLSLVKTSYNGFENVEHYILIQNIHKNQSYMGGVYSNFQTTIVTPYNAKGFHHKENYSV